jgi:hypothetical protein
VSPVRRWPGVSPGKRAPGLIRIGACGLLAASIRSRKAIESISVRQISAEQSSHSRIGVLFSVHPTRDPDSSSGPAGVPAGLEAFAAGGELARQPAAAVAKVSGGSISATMKKADCPEFDPNTP